MNTGIDVHGNRLNRRHTILIRTKRAFIMPDFEKGFETSETKKLETE